MRSYSVEGIVIKRSNTHEADRLITLFTQEQGKITVIAKGVRKLSSKRIGSLELFNLIKAQVMVGKGGLDVLAEVKVLKSNYSWSKYLGRVTLAYQLCEAVDKLTVEGQAHPHVFEILILALSSLGTLGEDWEEQMKVWFVEILIDLGYWSADKKFTGDIFNYIEDIAERSIQSSKLLSRLK